MAQQAFSLGAKEFHAQTWGETEQALVTTGKTLAAIDARIVVKVPITQLGTAAATTLISERVRVTLTAVYEVPQILIAATLGADYAAPYLGRINDSRSNGRESLAPMQKVLNGVQSHTHSDSQYSRCQRYCIFSVTRS